jgi:hypothetical protein
MEELPIVNYRLPLAMGIEFGECHETSQRFELTFEVKAAPHTLIRATVEKSDHESSVLVSIDSDESRILPKHLRSRMLLLSFRLLYREMVLDSGDAAEWHMNDACRWIRWGLGFVEGQQVISALLPHTPYLETFTSWNWVRIG